MSECWNTVYIYGCKSEINRLRETCIVASHPANHRGPVDAFAHGTVRIGLSKDAGVHLTCEVEPGASVDVLNFREAEVEPGVWLLAFDSLAEFPTSVFENISREFPELRFHCDCIDSLNRFMGYGWFNGPPEGEPFRQDMMVPPDYWLAGGGEKRSPTAKLQHDARVKALTEATQRSNSLPL